MQTQFWCSLWSGNSMAAVITQNETQQKEKPLMPSNSHINMRLPAYVCSCNICLHLSFTFSVTSSTMCRHWRANERNDAQIKTGPLTGICCGKFELIVVVGRSDVCRVACACVRMWQMHLSIYLVVHEAAKHFACELSLGFWLNLYRFYVCLLSEWVVTPPESIAAIRFVRIIFSHWTR